MSRLALPLSLALLALNGCGMTARPSCFPADTALPDAALLGRASIGRTAHDLGEALLAGDAARAQALLRADPALARMAVDPRHDMLTLAVAGCSADAVEAVLHAGAPGDGADRSGYPLRLALRANNPAMAHRLLSGGASPTPPAAPLAPLREAIARNSLGAVTMLIDFRADPNAMEQTGRRPLHIALDMERFRLAELLLARGADPFAIDVLGANLGSATITPMLTDSREEAAAQARLKATLPAIGWPTPIPDARTVRELALAGRWPPAGAKGAGPVPRAVLAGIKANAAHPGRGASVQ